MKKLVILATLLMSLSAFSAETVNVTVKGMVCSFCSQGITKKFQEAGVKDVQVDLGSHLVTLKLVDNQKLEDKKITDLLQDSGYGVEKIERK